MATNDLYKTDAIQTTAGELEISFIGHGTLMLKFGTKIIHIDPYSQVGDYSKLPKADIVLITHEHGDHLDLEALQQIRTADTTIVMSASCSDQIENGIVMKNGDVREIDGLKIEAVPAYNMIHKRDNGQYFHPRGVGNGYILTFGEKRVYIAGDTENIPEMKSLENIDCAFLPMNLPYTMTSEMVADAAKAFRPKILYPYHYGDTDTSKFEQLMKDTPEVEIRIRMMK